MKKTVSFLLAALVSVVFFANAALAARYEQNPDHIPSLGISAGIEGLTGSSDVTGPSPESQDTSLYRFDVTLDLRMPISERITVFGALSFLGSLDDIETGPSSLLGAGTDEFGGGGRIGLRIYFPQ